MLLKKAQFILLNNIRILEENYNRVVDLIRDTVSAFCDLENVHRVVEGHANCVQIIILFVRVRVST